MPGNAPRVDNPIALEGGGSGFAGPMGVPFDNKIGASGVPPPTDRSGGSDPGGVVGTLLGGGVVGVFS